MDSEQILKEVNDDDDVIHISGVRQKRTFCISEFRTMMKTAMDAIKKTYAQSLNNQGYPLHTKVIQ